MSQSNVIEREEVNSVSDPEWGVEAFEKEEIDRLVKTVRHVVWKELRLSGNEIYIMGSFARGEARRVVSDLDLRIEVDYVPTREEAERVQKLLKIEYGPEILPDAAGYLDANILPTRPGEDDPHEPLFVNDPERRKARYQGTDR